MPPNDGRAERPSTKLLIVDARTLTAPHAACAALDALDDEGVLEVAAVERAPGIAAFGAIAAALRAHGAAVDVSSPNVVRASRSAVPPLVDLTTMEAPGPLEATLLAAERLAPGERWCGRYPHYPVHLPPRLAARAVDFAIATRPDGSGVVWMRRR